MKHFFALLSILFISVWTIHLAYALISELVDFNNTDDLTNLFNDDGSPVFTNLADSGIANTGSVDVPLGSDDLWTTKQGYSVSGVGDIYRFSAYFKIKANAGRGGLGFSSQNPQAGGVYASPLKGIGVTFHGGGGEFINNGTTLQSLSWPPDLVIGDWYWMEFEVETVADNTYDLTFQIWESDSDGNLGVMKTEKTYDNLVNTDIGASNIIHTYFSASGSRMEKIDNFALELDGGASLISEGTPVVLTEETVTDIEDTSATSGGEVTDDQGGAVTARGVCWDTAIEPTTDDTCTTDGTGTGTFTSAITGLTAETTYYVRAYATNASGTSYGTEKSFTTTEASEPTPAPTSQPTTVAQNSGGGSGKAKTVRWRGMKRGELLNFGGQVTKHNFSEFYEKSKQHVAKMNSGVVPEQKYMVNRWGEHIFAGYLAGRIGLERFPHRYQNIVKFGSGSLTKGRGIVVQESEPFLASASKDLEELTVQQPTNEGWADEYQLAKDRFQKQAKSEDLFASAPVVEEKVTLAEDQIETHKNQRTYYRKKGVVDRKRDISMVRPSRMDATKDMDTIKIRFGNKKVALSKYLQNNLFGNTDGENDTSTSALLFLFLGSFGVIGIAMVWSLKRNKS